MLHFWTPNSHFGPFYPPRGLILVTFRFQNALFRPNPGPFLAKINLFGLRGVILGLILEAFWSQRDHFGPKRSPKSTFGTQKGPKRVPKGPPKEPLGTVLGPFWINSSSKGKFRTQKLQFGVKIILKTYPFGPFWVLFWGKKLRK